MTDQTKQCIACFEPIQLQARKCPHCQQIQTKVAALQNHPAASWAMVVIIAIMVVGVVWAIIGINKKRARPVPKLEVGVATVRVSIQPSSPRVSCFAPIKNGDNFVWSDPSLQARFFDAAGKEVDVHYERHHFNLYPFFEAQGRVSGPFNASPEDYSSCKISVLSID